MQKEIRIIPRKEYPFNIVTSTAKYGKDILFRINKNKAGEATEYLLKVKNLKKEKGVYRDKIILHTNSEIKPKIQIHVYVKIRERKQENKN